MRCVLTFLLLTTGCGLAPDMASPDIQAFERLDTSDKVFDRLQRLEHELAYERDKRAIFATSYRITTKNVKRAAQADRFQNRQWIEGMLVNFANKYLDALEGRHVSKPWQIAFQVADEPGSSALRNLLVSMSAHIIYDLPIATAETAPLTPAVEADFDTLNGIFKDEMDEVQRAVSLLYGPRKLGIPLLSLADGLGLFWDETAAMQVIKLARHNAWNNARLIQTNQEAGLHKTLKDGTAVTELLGSGSIVQALTRLGRQLL